MEDYDYAYEELGADSYSIELKAGGECIVCRNGDEFDFTWKLSGTELTLTTNFNDGEEELVYTGTLIDEEIRIAFLTDVIEVYTLD